MRTGRRGAGGGRTRLQFRCSRIAAAAACLAAVGLAPLDAFATFAPPGPRAGARSGDEGWVQPPVEFRGRADVGFDRRIRQVLERDYLLVHRDTLIARGDTVHLPVLVLDATLRLDGVVLGDVLAVDGRAFVRPTAAIHGDLVNLAGGIYPSALALIAGRVIDEPLATYRVVREPDRLVIEAWIDRTRWILDGLMGFSAPTYDRVDAVGLQWGGGVIIGRFGGPEPEVHARVGYRTGRRVFTGGAELRLAGERTAARLGAERTTRTMDDWIIGDVLNSVTFLFAGRDYRDYHDVRRAYAELSHSFVSGRLGGALALRAEVERGATVEPIHPWTLLRRDRQRPNAAVDDGNISGLTAMFEGEWQPGQSRLRAGLALEAASRVLGGDFAFGRHVVWGDWLAPTFGEQVLEVAWRFQGPLPGTDSLPRQRWSHVGGVGTLPLRPIGAFRGDRLVAVSTDYVIPMPEQLRLPVVGAPDLRLQHRLANAWTAEATRDLEQNVAIELRFVSPFIRVITDPADFLDEVRYEFGLAWPLDRRPWRAAADTPFLEPPL